MHVHKDWRVQVRFSMLQQHDAANRLLRRNEAVQVNSKHFIAGKMRCEGAGWGNRISFLTVLLRFWLQQAQHF